MKDNTLLTIAVCVAMACTPKVITQTILTEKKDENGNRIESTTELVIPKQYNKTLVVKKECNIKGKIPNLRKKKGSTKLYDAPICRGNTYRSNSNVKRVQRL